MVIPEQGKENTPIKLGSKLTPKNDYPIKINYHKFKALMLIKTNHLSKAKTDNKNNNKSKNLNKEIILFLDIQSNSPTLQFNLFLYLNNFQVFKPFITNQNL